MTKNDGMQVGGGGFDLLSRLGHGDSLHKEARAEIKRLQAHEHAAATILATALACDDYRDQHMEWMTQAARWLNEPRGSHEPGGSLPVCECLVRDKAPSAYHNVKCPRYVEGKW